MQLVQGCCGIVLVLIRCLWRGF